MHRVPPLFRVAIFDDGKTSPGYIEKSLLDVVPDMDGERAAQIASKVTNMGVGQVGVWVEEAAEGVADGLRERSLVVDVSAE